MANCTNLKTAWQLKLNYRKPNNTYPLEWRFQSQHTHDELQIPCLKCDNCLDDKISQTVLRFTHEAVTNEENCVLTLTYRPERLPPNAFLMRDHSVKFKKDLTRNLKNLGFKTPKISVKGEYGFHSLLPHFHLIVNGFIPSDLILQSGVLPDSYGHSPIKNKNLSKNLYTSKFISSLWPYGFITVGHINPDSIKYIVRDVKSSLEPVPPSIILRQKLIEPTLPFFRIANNVSRDWYQLYSTSDAYSYDFCITSDGHKTKVPKYYDNKLKITDPLKLEAIKQKRIQDFEARGLTPEDIERSNIHKALLRKRQKYESLKRRM